MRSTEFKLLALTLGIQLVLISSMLLLDQLPETAVRHFVGMTCFICSLAIPFVGYIVALYGAPFLSRVPRVLKVCGLVLLSLVLTGIGHLLALAVFMSAGVPLRHD